MTSIRILSYRKKLFLCMIFVCVAVLLANGIIAVTYTQYTTRNNEERHLTQLISVANQDISSRFSIYDRLCFNIVINQSLKQHLNDTDEKTSLSSRRIIENIIKTNRLSDSQIANIMIIDLNSSVYTTDISLMLPSGFQLESTQVFQQASKGNGNLVWLPENDIFDQYITSDTMYQSRTDIHAAAIIKDYTWKKNLGILILSLRKNYFQDIPYNSEGKFQTGLYLISPDRSRYYSIAGSPLLDESIIDNVNFNQISGFLLHGHYALDYLLNAETGWYFVSVEDANELFSVLYHLLAVMVFSICICIIFSIIISKYLSQSLYSGVKQLSDGMLSVKAGNLNATIASTSKDEFGTLATIFNEMTSRMRSLVNEKAEEQLAREKSEYEIMQKQINPHFLYNIFDMLHWRLISSGNEELAESVVSVSNMLRYAMSRENDFVSLDDELSNINDYIDVLKKISDHDINLSCSCDKPERIRLPKLTLQPLIENSVKHGFGQRRKGNRINVHGDFLSDGSYELTITDNGIGVSQEELSMLNRGISHEKEHGIGLKNIQLRLLYLYNGSSSIIFRSDYGSSFTVDIKFMPDKIRK